jgi:hypothetical protein
LNYLKAELVPLDVAVEMELAWDCMVALDGERELRGKKGDRLTFLVTQRGPWRVQIKRTLEKAVELGFFKRF